MRCGHLMGTTFIQDWIKNDSSSTRSEISAEKNRERKIQFHMVLHIIFPDAFSKIHIQ